jgi:hypothetical protein
MWRSVLLGVVLVVGVVLAGVLVGGGSGRPIGDTGVQSGTVSGRVVVKGGVQFPHRKKPPPATNTRFTFVAIPATGPTIVRHLKTDREGRFRLRLASGRYRFGCTFVASEPLAQAARQSMVVPAGRVVRVRLIEGVR